MKKRKFKIVWWKWYLADMTNWHKPVLVRLDFTNEAQAVSYRDRHFNSDFVPVKGAEATNFKLKDPAKKKRHDTWGKDKYDYPANCITEHDRALFRHYTRRKAKKMKRLPEITNKDVGLILDKKITRFMVRCSKYINWHYPYTEGTKNLNYYKRAYVWPIHIRMVMIIEKTLIDYKYEVGLWPIHLVAMKIYDTYGKSFYKWILWGDKAKINSRIFGELKERGFIPLEESGFKDGDYYVFFKYGGEIWVYKEKGWFYMPGKKTDAYFITWLMTKVGVNGITDHTWYPDYIKRYENS